MTRRSAAVLIVPISTAVAVLFSTVASAAPVQAQELPNDSWSPPAEVAPGDACSARLVGSNRTFDVGPGREHIELTTVPWLSLEAGDVVNIFHRSEPYRTKLGLRAQGTAAAPVIINGVTSSACERPTISGANAVNSDDAVAAQFYSTEFTEFLGTIFLYRASTDPFGHRPTHITIQNLRITGASIEDSYTGQDGVERSFGKGAAGVYAVVVDDLTLENNEITGNGNGVFVNTKSADETSNRIVLRRNSIYGNGTADSYLEHNLYIQARRSLYEGNYIGQLIEGAQGSSLKDRSSGTVVRYNRIDAAARALDLVEIEGGVDPVKNDPLYSSAWVYGNVIVTDHSRPGTSGALLVHWGGDNDPQHFRNGTLYFYNNTVIINSTRAQRYWFAMFDMDNNDQRVVAHSNVFANLKDAFMYMGRSQGTVELQGTNWATEGWGAAGGFEPDVTLIESGRMLAGADPRVGPDFVPLSGSPLVDQATSVSMAAPSPAIAANLAVDEQPIGTPGVATRPLAGSSIDLGAFELAGALTGDADCDGALSIRDSLVIAQYVRTASGSTARCPLGVGESISVAGADIDNSGAVDLSDIEASLRCIADRGCSP